MLFKQIVNKLKFSIDNDSTSSVHQSNQTNESINQVHVAQSQSGNDQTNDENASAQVFKLQRLLPRKENQIAVVDDVFLLSLLFNNVVHAMDYKVGNVQTSDCSKPIKFIETTNLLVSGIRKEETS